MLPGAEERNAAIEKAFSEGTLGQEPPVEVDVVQEAPEPEQGVGESLTQSVDDAGEEAAVEAPDQSEAFASEEPATSSGDLNQEATEADHPSKRFRDRFNRQIEARKAAEKELEAQLARATEAESNYSAMQSRLEALEALLSRQGSAPESKAPKQEPAGSGGEGSGHWLDQLLGSKDSFSQDEVREMLGSFGQQFEQRFASYDNRIREGEIIRETQKLNQEISAVRERFPDVQESWITDAIISSPDPESFNIEEFARSAQGFVDSISQRAVDGYASDVGAAEASPAPDSPPRPAGVGAGASAASRGAVNPEDEPEGARTIKGRADLLRKQLAEKFGAAAAGI